MKKFPTWLKILLPILLLGVTLVAAVAKLMMEEVPAHAQPTILEARFQNQLAFLSKMAADLPFKGCQDDLLNPASLLSDIDFEESADPEEDLRAHRDELLALIEPLRQWQDQTEAGRELLADPAILAAEILQLCDGSQSAFGVKQYEGPESTWSAAMLLPPDRQPTVSLWFAGMQRQVRYRVKVRGTEEDPLLVHLILDLEAL